MEERCIYLIESDTGRVKIGVAHDPLARLKQLQTGNPHRLTLLYSFHTNAGLLAESVERAIHKRLWLFRTGGEWFDAPRALIFWAVKNAWAELTEPLLYERWSRRFGRYARMCARQGLHFAEQSYMARAGYSDLPPISTVGARIKAEKDQGK